MTARPAPGWCWVWVDTGGRRSHLAQVEARHGGWWLLVAVAGGRRMVRTLCDSPPDLPSGGGRTITSASPPECVTCWRRWVRVHASRAATP